jgi:putative endonuclease
MKTDNIKKQNIWWLYMIRNRLNSIYTGISTDVERRFLEHSSGDKKGAKSLKGKGPLILLLKKRIGNKSKASKVEWHIKQLTKLQKENLVTGKLKWASIMHKFITQKSK